MSLAEPGQDGVVRPRGAKGHVVAMIETSKTTEGDEVVGLRITKATGITISVGLLIVLLGGAVGGIKLVYEQGRTDAAAELRMSALEKLAAENSAKLGQVLESTRRIEESMGDRWTRSHMRRLMRELRQANPGLVLPDVDEIMVE